MKRTIGLTVLIVLLAPVAARADEVCTAISDLAKGWKLVGDYIDEAQKDHAISEQEGKKIVATERELQKPSLQLAKLIKEKAAPKKIQAMGAELKGAIVELDSVDDDNSWDDDILAIHKIIRALQRLVVECRAG